MRDRANYELGIQIREHLKSLGLETPMSSHLTIDDIEGSELALHFQQILGHHFQLDLNDESLKETSMRVAHMYMYELFRGLDYRNFPKATTVPNKSKVDEVVVVKDIQLFSMCEHHLVPFIGTAHVGYIPKDRILGLSKFNRIVDFFARRPQIQERLTEQIYAALSKILGTPDVAVVIEASHLCVSLRGVRDVNSSTITSKMGGNFLAKPEARAEFFTLTGK